MTIRRWLRRAALGLVALTALVVLGGASWEIAMRRAALQTPPPGQLVDVGGGRRLQIDCRGAGSPTVVLESGLDLYGSLAWAAVHDSLARTTRVCAYSRAGIMWSDPAPGPLDAAAAARDLHAALLGGGAGPPWVMVAHSLGGPYAMVFTGLFDQEVAGVVLVDALHPDQFARFTEATRKAMQPPTGVIRIGSALAWTGIVRALPAPTMPAAWPAEVGQLSQTFLPVSIHGLLREIDAIPATLAAAGAYRSLGDRPLVVLSSGKPVSPEDILAFQLTTAEQARLQAAMRALQDDEATWSRRSRHEIVADASHYIQFDRPNVVISAVREVVATVRTGGSAGF